MVLFSVIICMYLVDNTSPQWFPALCRSSHFSLHAVFYCAYALTYSQPCSYAKRSTGITVFLRKLVHPCKYYKIAPPLNLHAFDVEDNTLKDGPPETLYSFPDGIRISLTIRMLRYVHTGLLMHHDRNQPVSATYCPDRVPHPLED